MSPQPFYAGSLSKPGTAPAKSILFGGFMAAFFIFSPGFAENCRDLATYYLHDTVADPGAHLLFGIFVRILEFIHPHVIGGLDVLLWETAMIALISLLILAPRIPLALTIGGQLALFGVWHTYREISHFGRAIEAWTVLIFAMFLVHLLYLEKKPRDLIVTVAFSVALGYLPLMRQSASFIYLVPCLIILIFCLRRRNLQRIIPILILLAVAAATHLGGLKIWEMRSGGPYVSHGAGLPLYLSLGFANNPYNIAWDDNCVWVHGLLIDKHEWTANDADQKRMVQVWWQRIKEDPGLVWKGAIAKSMYLLRYFLNLVDPRAVVEDGAPTRPGWRLTALAALCLFAAALSVPIFFRHPTDRLQILFAGGFGLMAASVLPLVIIVPFYFGSVLAFLLSFAFVLAPAAVLLGQADEPAEEGNARAYKIFFICCLCLIAVAGAYAAVRERINARLAKNASLNAYETACRFNRLTLTDQQRIVDGLMAANRPGDFRLDPGGKFNEKIFQPLLGIINDQAVLIIARMSKEWKMTLPAQVQGPRNSVLSVQINDDRTPQYLYMEDDHRRYQKIADANWDGRYRMFAAPPPVPAISADKIRFIDAGVYNFKSGSHTDGLALELVSRGRLMRGPSK